MDTLTTRQKLIIYLADADEGKVTGIYEMLEKEIAGEASISLTDAQLQLLEVERTRHINGESQSYNRKEADQIIRGLRSY